MKRFIMMVALAALVGSAAFSASNTYTSSATVFTNDADDFIDVNAWQSTAESTEKLFAYGLFKSANLDFGVAKKFGSVYAGLYFNGYIPQLSFGKNGDITTFQNSGSSFNPKLLLGFGNLGLRFEASLAPNSTENNNGTTKTTTNNTDTTLTFRAGYNLPLGNVKLTPHAAISYHFGKHSTVSETAGVTTTTFIGSSYDYLNFNLGTGVEFDQSAPVTQSFAFDVYGTFYFYPTELSKVGNEVTSRQDLYDNLIIMTPAYNVTYDVSDNFALGFKASLPVRFNSYKTAAGDPDTFDFGIGMNANLGIQFRPTEKITINGGAEFTLGNLLYLTSTSNSSNFRLFPGSMSATLATGFAYAFTPKVILDTTFNILTTTATGTTTSLKGIWEGDIGLSLILKL